MQAILRHKRGLEMRAAKFNAFKRYYTGFDVTGWTFCKNCDEEVYRGSIYCDNCGVNLWHEGDLRRKRGREMRRIRYRNAFLLALIRQYQEEEDAEYMRYLESRYSINAELSDRSDDIFIVCPPGKPVIRYCGWPAW